MSTAPDRHAFLTLDGLRGLAALAVLSEHYAAELAPIALPGAYLAVDLFFLMSGFVLEHAYAGRLAGGMGARRFMAVRLLRLYPLYILGTALGALTALAALATHMAHGWTWPGFAATAAAAALMLPGPPVGPIDPALYLFNFPAWSLLFELAANLVYAAAFARLRGRALPLLIGGFAVLLAASALWRGDLDRGWRWPDAEIGLVRVGFSFFLGVALCRLHRAGRLPRLPLPPALVLAASLLAFLAAPPFAWRGLFDACAALILFPLLLCAAVGQEPVRGARLFAWAGLVSYPLYMLHVPADHLVEVVMTRILHIPVAAEAPWLGLALCAVMVAVSWAAARFYDAPARRRLARAIERGPASLMTRPTHPAMARS